MPDTRWRPELYLQFGAERTRPFIDLLSRIPLETVELIVDLGCGPGNGEPPLRAFWPQAHITGVDSSFDMIQQARENTSDTNVSYLHQDLREWMAESKNVKPQMIVSNAMFQWVEGHLEFLPRVADAVDDGGVFAFQVPGNFDAPSHVLLREIAAQPRYAEHITEKLRDTVIRADQYLEKLNRPGWSVDAWETTYLHQLEGEHPVYDWISSTGARPVLNALTGQKREQFIAEYKEALTDAYPVGDLGDGRRGTALPFRRIFIVAHRVSR